MSLLFENVCEGCGKEFTDDEKVFIFCSTRGKVNKELILVRGNKTVYHPFEVSAFLEIFCRPCFQELTKNAD